MSRVSVVTVALDNARGLEATLGSLARLGEKPHDVIVIDGGSRDDTGDVVRTHSNKLNIRYVSEPDRGIYDAMNKGRRLASGDLVHYLNAGDTVLGEPYGNVSGPCLLAVHIHDDAGRFLFDDFVKHGGFGYCHQGILFARDHPDYREEYRVAADLDLIVASFPRGLRALPRSATGAVRFAFGGLSSRATSTRNREVCRILFQRLPWWTASHVYLGIELKNLVPRALRRAMVGALAPRGQRR